MTLKDLNKIINDETRHPQTRMSALFKKQELIIKRCGQMKKKAKNCLTKPLRGAAPLGKMSRKN